jgi:hypothetical protein
MSGYGAEASSDAQPRMIGPPPNPDHDRSDPLPRPILEVHIGQSRAAAELSRQNPSPISPRAGFAGFSRTLAGLHRQFGAHPLALSLLLLFSFFEGKRELQELPFRPKNAAIVSRLPMADWLVLICQHPPQPPCKAASSPAELPQAAERAPVPRRATDENNPQSHGLPGSGCALYWR